MSHPITPAPAPDIERIIAEMRSEGPRYKSHDLGFVDSVASYRVDEWADELESAVATLRATLREKEQEDAGVLQDAKPVPDAREERLADDAPVTGDIHTCPICGPECSC